MAELLVTSTTTDGFCGTNFIVDDNYVDGLSITYDSSPRRHLWTYVCDESEANSSCPCASARPFFVQDHYYCESGTTSSPADRWFTEDPLWDGEGCSTGNTCCNPPNLPWFNRVIDTPSTADIEMRLCQDQIAADEDFAVELFELYVY